MTWKRLIASCGFVSCWLLWFLLVLAFSMEVVFFFDGSWFFRWMLVFPMDIDWLSFIYLFNFWLLLQLKQQSFSYDGVLSYKFLVVLLPGFLVGINFVRDSFFGGGVFYVIVGVLLFDSCFWLHFTCVFLSCGGHSDQESFLGSAGFPWTVEGFINATPPSFILVDVAPVAFDCDVRLSGFRIVIEFFIIFQDGWAWVWSLYNFWKVSAIVGRFEL